MRKPLGMYRRQEPPHLRTYSTSPVETGRRARSVG